MIYLVFIVHPEQTHNVNFWKTKLWFWVNNCNLLKSVMCYIFVTHIIHLYNLNIFYCISWKKNTKGSGTSSDNNLTTLEVYIYIYIKTKSCINYNEYSGPLGVIKKKVTHQSSFLFYQNDVTCTKTVDELWNKRWFT